MVGTLKPDELVKIFSLSLALSVVLAPITRYLLNLSLHNNFCVVFFLKKV